MTLSNTLYAMKKGSHKRSAAVQCSWKEANALASPSQQVPERKEDKKREDHASIYKPLVCSVPPVNDSNKAVGDAQCVCSVQQLLLCSLEHGILVNEVPKDCPALPKDVIERRVGALEAVVFFGQTGHFVVGPTTGSPAFSVSKQFLPVLFLLLGFVKGRQLPVNIPLDAIQVLLDVCSTPIPKRSIAAHPCNFLPEESH